MNYQLVDYQGNSISIPDNKAKKIAESKLERIL
jgi:hypothetical protein